MKTERFAGHHEGWRTLWLTIAGVMAIMTWAQCYRLKGDGNVYEEIERITLA